MIPKVIHYIWLSGEELPALNRSCVESWQRVLKGYELRCWSGKDFFDVDSVPFLREAVHAGKWAFAADFLRAWILYREGGIYLDSDVYLYTNFDPYLDNRFFSCIERHHDSTASVIQAACMGAEAGHPFLDDCIRYYRQRHFLRPDGSPDTEQLAPDVYAALAESYGFDPSETGAQQLREGIRIYDRSMVAGTPWEIGKDSIAVHMCSGSWRDIPSEERVRVDTVKRLLTLRAELQDASNREADPLHSPACRP